MLTLLFIACFVVVFQFVVRPLKLPLFWALILTGVLVLFASTLLGQMLTEAMAIIPYGPVVVPLLLIAAIVAGFLLGRRWPSGGPPWA